MIDPERPDQLQEAILFLSTKPKLRAAMGQRGKEIASHYTAPVMAEKYLGLYEAVVGESIG